MLRTRRLSLARMLWCGNMEGDDHIYAPKCTFRCVIVTKVTNRGEDNCWSWASCILGSPEKPSSAPSGNGRAPGTVAAVVFGTV